MKSIVIKSLILLAGTAAFAPTLAQAPLACDAGDSVVTAPEVIGNTVCVGSTGNWEGQEWHSGTSGDADNLIDFKGGSNPTNKSEPVGSWSNAGNLFTYNYGGGTVFHTLYCRNLATGVYFVNSAGRKDKVGIAGGNSGC